MCDRWYEQKGRLRTRTTCIVQSGRLGTDYIRMLADYTRSALACMFAEYVCNALARMFAECICSTPCICTFVFFACSARTHVCYVCICYCTCQQHAHIFFLAHHAADRRRTSRNRPSRLTTVAALHATPRWSSHPHRTLDCPPRPLTFCDRP